MHTNIVGIAMRIVKITSKTLRPVNGG